MIDRTSPLRFVVLGYASYIVAGWLLLCLPWSQQAGQAGWLDHLFTATSAVSTTGLVTVSTNGSYSWFGEAVVLLLIQFGGLGYMTISSFIVLAVAGDLSPLRRSVSAVALTLPQGLEIHLFLRTICWFTLLVELAGAAALYPSFAAAGAPQPAWQAVFHSVSAFCTAGFGLFDNSFEDYRDDVWLNLVVTALSYLGAIGFIVIHDVWRSLRSRRVHATLTSKVILWSTFWIGLIGTVLFALDEPSLAGLPPFTRWMAAAFQVMTASTTVGFNTIPIGKVSASSLFLLTVIMIIGASPSGTGGGLKTTTLSAVWAEMLSVVRRRSATTFLGKVIPEVRMRMAVANLVFYLSMLAAGIYILALVDGSPLADQMFECASALGTVGLSRGITGSLSSQGKLTLIALMFIGRIGPVALGMAFFKPAAATETASSEEDVAI